MGTVSEKEFMREAGAGKNDLHPDFIDMKHNILRKKGKSSVEKRFFR
jgi:hypothetical protein